METELSRSGAVLAADSLPASVSVTRPVGTIACIVAADIVAVVAGAILRDALLAHPATHISPTILAALGLVLCSLTAAGVYSGVRVNPVEELRTSTLSITLAFLSLWSATFFLHDLSQSRLVCALAYILTVILIPLFN